MEDKHEVMVRKGLIKLRENFHNKVLHVRCIEYILKTYEFEDFWDSLSEDDKIEFEEILNKLNKDDITKYMKEKESNTTVQELRQRASKLGIRSYSTMYKHELLYHIKESINEKSGNDPKS